MSDVIRVIRERLFDLIGWRPYPLPQEDLDALDALLTVQQRQAFDAGLQWRADQGEDYVSKQDEDAAFATYLKASR